jgi:hypothetical protein
MRRDCAELAQPVENVWKPWISATGAAFSTPPCGNLSPFPPPKPLAAGHPQCTASTAADLFACRLFCCRLFFGCQALCSSSSSLPAASFVVASSLAAGLFARRALWLSGSLVVRLFGCHPRRGSASRLCRCLCFSPCGCLFGCQLFAWRDLHPRRGSVSRLCRCLWVGPRGTVPACAPIPETRILSVFSREPRRDRRFTSPFGRLSGKTQPRSPRSAPRASRCLCVPRGTHILLPPKKNVISTEATDGPVVRRAVERPRICLFRSQPQCSTWNIPPARHPQTGCPILAATVSSCGRVGYRATRDRTTSSPLHASKRS